MTKKAFTLIELLVVIAIIAILAAILFPVFAQAKAAAKKSVAISNQKQIALANLMYANDADDAYPLNATVIDAAEDNLQWQDLIQPYAKNYGIVFDPVSDNQSLSNGIDYVLNFGVLPRAVSVGTGAFSNYITRTSSWIQNYVPAGAQYDGIQGFAFNAAFTGTYYGYNMQNTASLTTTAIARPAETIYSFDSNNWDGWHGIYGMQVGIGYCGGWAAGQGFTADYGFFGPQPRHQGHNICVVATRATDYGTGYAVMTMSDGHAKPLNAGQFLNYNAAGNFLTYFWPNE